MRWFLFCSFLVFVGTDVRAAILFDNFGPSDAYNQTATRSTTTPPFGNPPADHDIAQAFRFSGEAATLKSIQLALWNSGSRNELDVYLTADNWVGNKDMGHNASLLLAPDLGQVLEHFHISNQISSAYPGTVISLTSVIKPVLQPDTYYWIVLSAPEQSSSIAWFGAPESLNGKPAIFAERDSSITSFPLWQVSQSTPGFAFRVTADPVPEPTAFGLWALGLTAVAVSRRKLFSAT